MVRPRWPGAYFGLKTRFLFLTMPPAAQEISAFSRAQKVPQYLLSAKSAWLNACCLEKALPTDHEQHSQSQRSARSDGRFRGDSQSPGIGPRDARHHDGTHARPVRPSFGTEGMAPEVAASRAPSASTISISAALDEQADLGAASVGFRAAELQQLCGAHRQLFFVCARAGARAQVAWRGVWRGVLRAPKRFLLSKPPWA